MKKRKQAAPASSPADRPMTEQHVRSEEGEPPYLPKRARQKTMKRKPSITIAPGLRSTRDVFINLPK